MLERFAEGGTIVYLLSTIAKYLLYEGVFMREWVEEGVSTEFLRVQK